MILSCSEIRTMVHHVTKRTGTPVHDEDLEQEIALSAVVAFQRLDRVAHPRALLMKIVYDAARDTADRDLGNVVPADFIYNMTIG